MMERTAYAAFRLGILNSKGIIYFVLTGILTLLCTIGIITFIKTERLIIGGD